MAAREVLFKTKTQTTLHSVPATSAPVLITGSVQFDSGTVPTPNLGNIGKTLGGGYYIQNISRGGSAGVPVRVCENSRGLEDTSNGWTVHLWYEVDGNLIQAGDTLELRIQVMYAVYADPTIINV